MIDGPRVWLCGFDSLFISALGGVYVPGVSNLLRPEGWCVSLKLVLDTEVLELLRVCVLISRLCLVVETCRCHSVSCESF